MSLPVGTKLGPYEIQAPLGAGGTGEVYRARNTRLDRTVAVKILPSHLSSDPDARQRFEREAKIISSLNHPHICVLHDVGHQDGINYLVMECVEGETLAKRLEKGALPLEQVLKLGAEGDTLMAAEVEASQNKFEVKNVRSLFRVNLSSESMERSGSYDVAADGTHFVINASSDEAQPPITLVLNWTAALPKK